MLDTPKGPLTKADQQRALTQMLKFYGDREWRLDHLYHVQDETGTKVLYRRRPAQKAYCENQWILDIITKSRQLGFSTEIAIEICDFCVFNKDKAAGIIDYKLEDAKKKLAKIKFAYDHLPEWLKQRNPLIKDNEDELRWANGSSVVVGTSHRGGTLQFLHWSEAGKTAAEKPEVAKEIIAGALNTIAPGQIIKVESTAHGTSGIFYDMVERAKAKLASGTPLSVLDFKLHFYGWMFNPANRVQSNLVIITQEVRDYFDKLKQQQGIVVDGDQMAFYQQKFELLGWDKMFEEHPSHIGELFYNSLEGAFFKKELSRARADKRIGFSVPYDPTRRVHTCWDKGMNEKSDRNAIWWFQHDGVRFRWIDYHENAGENIAYYARIVEEKRIARKFIYGVHYGPHDLKNRDWGSTSPAPKTMQDIAKDVGINFKIVDRVDDKEVSIEAARRAIGVSYFCSEYCARGVEGLDNYRKTWNKIIADWTTTPFHNWASNCFVGDTEVLTRDGIRRISDLPYFGEVLTLCGWKPYRNPRVTLKDAPLVEVRFSDGLSVKCTPDHLFLTANGWKSAESLLPGSLIRSSSIRSPNISTASSTRSIRRMDIIDPVRSSTAKSGRAPSVLYRQTAISIMSTIRKRTTGSKIWNACRRRIMAVYHGAHAMLLEGTSALMTLRANERPNGIDQMLVSSGTVAMRSAPHRTRNGSARPSHALTAGNRFKPSSATMDGRTSIAPNPVGTLSIISVERLQERAEVWDLTVPEIEHFALANGAIVHNSADALQCGAMGIVPDKPERTSRRDRLDARKGTHWSA